MSLGLLLSSFQELSNEPKIVKIVIGFGDGTKQLQYLNQSSSTKEYVACGQLGVATDTYDPLGAETRRAPYDHVTAEGLREVLQSKFLGKIMQRPPAYSALKKDGVRFSDLNRSGVDVRPEARERHVSDIQLLKFEPPFFTISVTCNSGTYVRSLVYDIAENMDTVAHVRTLQRLRVTRFTHHNALRQESWTLGHVYGALLRQRKEQERMLQDGVDPETAL
ncbi:pseudouridylate synthase TRUB1-like isoform X2 [Sycon ciliatum]|uniref:pseudouridylate synthase TRUB1-like isoform X2 n=1 Tax=Sycon ciliatum TaxID=27933 RepID=UPI0031F6D3E8